ncbi:glycosyltransferase [Apibacter adventoris]|uniref:glycosyltransferase n=1 Tax=Apibacter adventoris TaxID=1679466 RepID=UPI000CF6F885|nr:glycosyltransferase [Apibacter adventoris]PQL92482.1 glycosyl transferase family 1 [Apibacter adventoris]
MKRIIFDLTAVQPNDTGIFHGGGKYAKTVFLELIKSIPSDYLYVLYDSKQFIEEFLLYECEAYGVNILDISKHSLKELIFKYNIKIFYTSIPSYYIKEKFDNECKFVCTIHDLREIELVTDTYEIMYTKGLKNILKLFIKKYFPKIYINHQISKYYEFLKNNSTDFITVTNYSKYSLLTIFPFLKEENIQVLYSPLYTIKENSEKYISLVEEPYFLLVSGDRWVKNNYRAIKALDGLYSKGLINTYKVLLTGCKKKNIYKNHITNKDKFIFIDYVDEELLDKLYKNCYAFIYPTLNEGFGYPPLEAMRYKKPVLSSASSSLLELLEDSVLYFNPYTIIEIQNKIMQILNLQIYNKYSKKAYNRYLEVRNRQDEDLKGVIDFIVKKIK